MIDDELDNHNDKYEYKFDEIAVNRKYYKPCGYQMVSTNLASQNLWYCQSIIRFEYLVDVSIVVESDFICALVCKIMIFGKNKYSLPQFDDWFD